MEYQLDVPGSFPMLCVAAVCQLDLSNDSRPNIVIFGPCSQEAGPKVVHRLHKAREHELALGYHRLACKFCEHRTRSASAGPDRTLCSCAD
jgi:hypothetical protein